MKKSNKISRVEQYLESAPMRVLFLSLRADFGGGPEHLWQLIKNKPSDVQVYVACPKDYPYYDRYCDCVGKENVFILPHRRFSLTSFWQLRAFCRECNVSILHSHGKGAGLYARVLAALTGLPCVHTFHGVHILEYSPLKKKLYCFAEKSMALFTRVGIAVSKGELQKILNEGLMPKEKLHLIENGVVIPNAVVIANGPPYGIVSITRFDIAKNSEFIIDILLALRNCNRLDDFRFILIGEGAGKARVEFLAQEKGLTDIVNCVGSTLEPKSYFNGALAYLSTSRWEGMPLAVLEAMAGGLPAIVTDVVGNRDVVTDGETGVIYKEGDAMAAAKALCRFVDDPAWRQALATRSREYLSKQHDVRTMASTTFTLLHEANRVKFLVKK